MLNPQLSGKPVTVGGDVENQNGIILAKSNEDKKCGVQTAEALWQAKQKGSFRLFEHSYNCDYPQRPDNKSMPSGPTKAAKVLFRCCYRGKKGMIGKSG